MPKFYEVEITTTAIVQADDEDSARRTAELDQSTVMNDDPYPNVNVVREVRSLKDLPSGWNGDCIPYGGDGNAYLSSLLPA